MDRSPPIYGGFICPATLVEPPRIVMEKLDLQTFRSLMHAEKQKRRKRREEKAAELLAEMAADFILQKIMEDWAKAKEIRVLVAQEAKATPTSCLAAEGDGAAAFWARLAALELSRLTSMPRSPDRRCLKSMESVPLCSMPLSRVTTR